MARHKHRNGEHCLLCAEKLEQVHPDLVRWFVEIVKPEFPDAHIAWGWRGKKDQDRFYIQGKSDKQFPFSRHNRTDKDGRGKSEALDIFRLTEHNTAAYNWEWFEKIKQHSEEADWPIGWGGTWKLKDGTHFETV